MRSIPSSENDEAHEISQVLGDAAHRVAVQLALPWGLTLLREQGMLGFHKARAHSDENPGLPVHQFVSKYFLQEAMAKGQQIRAQRVPTAIAVPLTMR